MWLMCAELVEQYKRLPPYVKEDLGRHHRVAWRFMRLFAKVFGVAFEPEWYDNILYDTRITDPRCTSSTELLAIKQYEEYARTKQMDGAMLLRSLYIRQTGKAMSFDALTVVPSKYAICPTNCEDVPAWVVGLLTETDCKLTDSALVRFAHVLLVNIALTRLWLPTVVGEAIVSEGLSLASLYKDLDFSLRLWLAEDDLDVPKEQAGNLSEIEDKSFEELLAFVESGGDI